MADRGVTTLQLPLKTTANTGDVVVFIYNYATANSSNTGSAQTSIAPLSNVLPATFGQLITDPSHSNTLTVTQGSLLFSNSYLYFATSNNNLVRLGPFSSF